MSRSKIVVRVGAIPGHHTRALRVSVTASTTCAQVLRKALEKCRVTEPPFKYQLWAVGRAPGRGEWVEHNSALYTTLVRVYDCDDYDCFLRVPTPPHSLLPPRASAA